MEWYWIILIIILTLAFAFLMLYFVLKMICYCTSKHYEILADYTEHDVEMQHIKFLQYNTFWRPTLLHMKNEEYMRERSILLLERIGKYDFICLQEAFQFGSSIATNFVNEANKKGFKYVVSCQNPPLCNKQIIDSGVIVLSKLPILETDCIRYVRSCDWDSFSAKGAVYAKIQVGVNKWIHVFASHLQSLYGRVEKEPFEIILDQFDQLSAFMADKVHDQFPVFLTGDLNIDASKGNEYDRMLEHLNLPGFVRKDVLYDTFGSHPFTFGNLTYPTPEDWGVRPSIDYIFMFQNYQPQIGVSATGAINKMPVEGKPYVRLSDHYAVEIDLDFQ